MIKNSNKNKNKLLFSILGGIFLYLASTGASYASFRLLLKPIEVAQPTTDKKTAAKSKINLTAPKTESCPLSGEKFTKDEKKIWEQRRPLTIMIENHADSRPQSGLSRADVIYEAVAEGGITRFLAVYYCRAAADDVTVAPVRSARVYYVNWASEYGLNPIYVHVGGANNFSGSGETTREARALEMLAEIKWRFKWGNDFDASFDVGFPVFWRDYERLDHPVATEHTMVSTTERLWEEAAKRGWNAVSKKGEKWDKTFVPWKFKDDAGLDKRGAIGNVKIQFSGNYEDYAVDWQYSKEQNNYSRLNGGKPHTDLNNNEQLQAKTIIIQFCKERVSVDANKHMLYNITGTGKALVFHDGQVVEANWFKKDRQARTIFTDNRGKEISFNSGPIWIEIVASAKQVAY